MDREQEEQWKEEVSQKETWGKELIQFIGKMG